MSSGIYQITNQVNGNRYIGSAVNIQQRWRKHLSGLRRQQHFNRHLQVAFTKYKEPEFVLSVIEYVEPQMLIEREQHYLDTRSPEYNISPTAGSNLGCHCSSETRRKLRETQKGRIHSKETRVQMSESASGERNPFYGKRHSEESRRKMTKAQTGRHQSEESRRKLSEAISGERHYGYGKHLSNEHRKKISEANKGKRHTEETRKKLSEGMMGERNPNYGKHPSEETRRKMSDSHKAFYCRLRALQSPVKEEIDG